MAALASALAGHRLIALDTSIWICHFEGSATYGQAADRVLEAVNAGHVAAVASELVLLELLVAPLKKGAQDVADEIELTLLHFPHLQLAPMTRSDEQPEVHGAIPLTTIRLARATLAASGSGH